jgi:amino acid permease
MFSKNYFLAIATLTGTVIGAGIFALPILVNRSGVVPFLLFLAALTAIQYLFHKMYAMVILSTNGEHRIPGYVEAYGGRKYKKIVSLIALAGGYGGLLAYVILGGLYAHELLSPFWGGSVTAYTVAIFAIESVVVLFGLKAISRAEMVLASLLFLVAGVITIRCFASLEVENLSLFDWRFALLLYGPVFFSLGGDAAIPEVCRLLAKEKRKIKSAVFIGTIIPAVVTGLFVLAVVGATGDRTTPDTLIGLNRVLDGGIIYFALIFGLVNIVTSFLTSLQAVREIYWWDFKMDKTWAWFLAAIVPLGLFLAGAGNVTKVVSLTGAITGGILGLVMIVLAQAATRKPQKEPPFKMELSSTLAGALCLIFIAGLIYEVLSVFKII